MALALLASLLGCSGEPSGADGAPVPPYTTMEQAPEGSIDERSGMGGGSNDVVAAGAGAPVEPAIGSPASEGSGGAIGLSATEGTGGTEPAPPAMGGMGPAMPADPGNPSPLWVGTWATGPQLTEPNNLPPAPGLANNTLRQKVLVTLAGNRVRLLLSNGFGNAPVTFNAVRIARAGAASAIEPSTERALLFGGSPSVTIPAGQTQLSDPLDYSLEALSQLAITLQFGNVPTDVTGHPGSRTTSYIMPGNAVSAASMPQAVTTDHWYFITGIDVEVTAPSAAVVTLGDSITDGRGSTTNGNDRWPDQLARRLQSNATTRPVAVLNMGIGGNQVVSGGLGPTAVARYQRDVLEQRGVRWVIVLEGVNDIGNSSDAGIADRLISAYEGFIDAAHARDIRVYGAPILPFGGNGYGTPAHEAARQAVNAWIRTSGRFDAVIDLDAAVRDPANPNQLLRAYDSGDFLHLSPAGYQAMANAIDLALFTP
jgi:lysophospholipase L1-like esterase